MADILDILELERTPQSNESQELRKKKKALEKTILKKPEGMNREVFALLCSDKNDPAPLIPTDIAISSKLGFPPYGYKKAKANLGLRNARKWAWIAFTNPARKDGFQLYHWRREMDRSNEYPFAQMNIANAVPSYTDTEYQEHLTTSSWTKPETDYLFRLARKFDLRFIVMEDRWDTSLFHRRTIEEMKERYYNVVAQLAKARERNADANLASLKKQICVFDAEHERKRKEQLNKLYKRTPEEIEEAHMLTIEERKIEHGKKERERKQQALQKLITASDQTPETIVKEGGAPSRAGAPNTGGGRGAANRKSRTQLIKNVRLSEVGNVSMLNASVESAGIKFPESKSSGVYLRSSRMKLPSSVGQKRTKAIENLLGQLTIEPHPIPTADVVQQFNDLRSDIVVIYELKTALSSLEFELTALKHQLEAQTGSASTLALAPSLPSVTATPTPSESLSDALNVSSMGSKTPLVASTSSALENDSKTISELIEVNPGTPRRRRAAIEQVNMMRKLRKN